MVIEKVLLPDGEFELLLKTTLLTAEINSEITAFPVPVHLNSIFPSKLLKGCAVIFGCVPNRINWSSPLT